MKRSEIELGVEYAMHGPKAYGKIPQVQPRKIRFTSKDPNYRLIVAFRVGINSSGKHTLGLVSHRISNEYFGLPVETYRSRQTEAEQAEVGHIIELVREPAPGALPAEQWVFAENRWEPIMAQPAAVHYTWDGWAEHQTAMQQQSRQQRVNIAPDIMRGSWRSIVDQARILKFNEDDLRKWVEERIKETTL